MEYTIGNIATKIQVLEENAEINEMEVKDYVEYSAEEDPTFYRWLFDSETDDYECPNKDAFIEFVNSL